MEGGASLAVLAELLHPPDQDEEEEEALDVHPSSPYATPSSIGPPSLQQSSSNPSREIWSPDEVAHQYEYEDPRPEPEYEMVFKQAVTTEDVFLGLGLKNPTTASCEDLLVKIKLPNTDFKQVELDVSDTFLDCRTPNHRLGLHLPHSVDAKQSKAKWISDRKELEITLKLKRDLDFLNQ